MSQVTVGLDGSTRSVIDELLRIASEVAGDFGPAKPMSGGARIIRAERYHQDGRLTSIKLTGLGHRGKIADEMSHYADELTKTLQHYEEREAQLCSP